MSLTDYLEEALDRAGRLLEQVRLAERELSGPGTENGEKGAPDWGSGPPAAGTAGEMEDRTAVDRVENIVNSDKNIVDNTGITPRLEINGEKRTVNPEAENGEKPAPQGMFAELGGEADMSALILQAEGGDEGADQPALAVQLERLERTAPVTGVGSERRDVHPASPPGLQLAAYPQMAGGAGERPDVSDGHPAAFALSGGEAGWAERTDRVFRRDSRRYDGGFYLY